jgi:hypothetical protein
MATRKKAKGKANAKRKKPLATKAAPRRKTRTVKKKAGEKGAGPASITQEFQADREGRRQADAHQPAGAACRSHTEPDRATHPPGGAYRLRHPLLQPPVSRDPAAGFW